MSSIESSICPRTLAEALPPLAQRLQLCRWHGLLRVHLCLQGLSHLGLHGFAQRGFGHSRFGHCFGHDGFSVLQQHADKPTARPTVKIVSNSFFIFILRKDR